MQALGVKWISQGTNSLKTGVDRRFFLGFFYMTNQKICNEVSCNLPQHLSHHFLQILSASKCKEPPTSYTRLFPSEAQDTLSRVSNSDLWRKDNKRKGKQRPIERRKAVFCNARNVLSQRKRQSFEAHATISKRRPRHHMP